MSVEQLAVCLHHSRATGTDKLVLIGIANHAGDGGAWPAVATLARYANVKPRAVQKSLARLIELGEVVRYVQAGGLQGWEDFLRPNRYDVTVTCPDWCDRGPNHRPRQGWAYDDDGNVVRVDHLPTTCSSCAGDGRDPIDPVQPCVECLNRGLSTGDTPDVQNSATRRADPLSYRTPGVPQDTPPVSARTPKPSTNQPDVEQVPASTTDRARVAADDVDLSTVREQLRRSTELHDRHERGER